MVTLKSCPNCGDGGLTIFPQIGASPRVKYEIMPKTLVEALIVSRYSTCKNCRLIFQNPRFSDEELDRFYADGFYRKVINLTDDEMDKDEELRAKKDFEIVKPHIGKIDSHLDIGSSRGYILDTFNANLKVGVEPNLNYNYSKKATVYRSIDELQKNKFDLVTVIHTLEHLSDPFKFLKKSVKHINNKGYLVIEVPTWESPGGPLRLPHLYHFEPNVLRRICIDLGLKIKHEEFTPHLLLVCQKV